jgi:hypothetical protein
VEGGTRSVHEEKMEGLFERKRRGESTIEIRKGTSEITFFFKKGTSLKLLLLQFLQS